MRQLTLLGMTLTRAFEKLRDVGLIVPLASHPLPHPIPPHFHLHEHCLYHQIQRYDTKHCATLHHAIQDLIDLGLVNLSEPSVTTNSLPTHSTHATPPPPPPPPSLQQIDLDVDGIDGHMIFFGIFWVKDLVQLTWVHHFAAVMLEELFILIKVIIRVLSVLPSPVFSSLKLFLFC